MGNGGNPNHGSDGKFTSGSSGGRYSKTVAERNAMRAMVDKRRFDPGRTSNRSMAPEGRQFVRPVAENPLMGLARATGLHTLGIHQATSGRTLAQTSAAGTNQAFPPPKINGGS